MTKNKKRVTKKSAEAGRGDIIDTMLTYLEAGDFKPPVREFYPLLLSMLMTARTAMIKHTEAGFKAVTQPVGIIAVGEKKRGELFKIDCCFPADVLQFRKTLRMLSGADVKFPADAVLSQVVSFRVRPDGTCSKGLPEFLYNSKSLNGSGFWFPVVQPESTAKPVRKTGGSGEHGTFREGFEMKSPDTGFTPYMACVSNASLDDIWSVRIAAENCRSEMVFLTCEEGVKGFFDLRDAPGGGRRAALKHFVEAHVRKTKNTTTVREHFRGKEDFSWLGLQCRVVPPRKTVDRVEALKPEAQS